MKHTTWVCSSPSSGYCERFKADPEPQLEGGSSEAWLSSHKLRKLFLEASQVFCSVTPKGLFYSITKQVVSSDNWVCLCHGVLTDKTGCCSHQWVVPRINDNRHTPHFIPYPLNRCSVNSQLSSFGGWSQWIHTEIREDILLVCFMSPSVLA